MILSIAVVLVCVFSIYLGAVVYIRNKHELVNRLFFLLAITAALWTFASYFGGHVSNRALSDVLVRIDYGTGLFMTWLFMLFGLVLNNTTTLLRSVLRKTIVISTPIIVFLVGASASPLVLMSHAGSFKGTSLFFPLYELPQFAFIMIGLWYLIRAYRGSVGIERNRRGAIIAGLVVSSFSMGIPYLIAGNFIHTASTLRTLQELGSLSLIAFVASSGYAIIRHHLFDIRAAIARTSAYVFSIGLIVAAYTFFAWIISNLFSSRSDQESSQKLVFTVFVAVVAILFQQIKKIFDKLSDAIFYRNTYDPQSLLDELGSKLVGSLDVTDLVSAGVGLLSRSIRPSYVVFALRSAGADEYSLYGSNVTVNINERVHRILESLTENTTWPLIVDELSPGPLKDSLTRSKTFFIMEVSSKDERLGYAILGEKKNGSIYNSQDSTFVSILSDEMAIAIQNAQRYHEIEGFNVKLTREIESATRELRRSNTKLQALDEAKDEFISMASHQLRTPLTSIKGYLSMVLEGDVGEVPDQQKQMLTTAFMSAQRMVYLISDLLNVSRLQTGKFVIEPIETYLPTLIEEELNQLREAIAAKNITLVYDKPEQFSTLMLDETKIRQVVMNFADNALYYTQAGGKVTLELKESAKSVEFTVTDNGIGVPKAEQHRLFTKFYRAGNARKARPDGTGLGLFMAKKVIAASGGSIIFKSKENQGSTFGFIFPKK